MKKIEIIPIAKRKCDRRNISEKMITQTLNSPIEIVEGYGGRRVAHGKHRIAGKEYLLRVIFEEKEETCIVVSAYLTSQIRRYWKGVKDED